MKILILTLSAAVLLPAFVKAGDDIVALDAKANKKNDNLYRIVPRGTMIPGNRGGGSGANSGSGGYSGSFAGGVHFKPTLHYYTKDATISYRYAEDRANSSDYLGPNASYYNPHREGLAPNVSIRSLAHIEPSRQPGVPMKSNRWREQDINNFAGDTYYRRADATKSYHGGNIEPGDSTGGSGKKAERSERAER